MESWVFINEYMQEVSTLQYLSLGHHVFFVRHDQAEVWETPVTLIPADDNPALPGAYLVAPRPVAVETLRLMVAVMVGILSRRSGERQKKNVSSVL